MIIVYIYVRRCVILRILTVALKGPSRKDWNVQAPWVDKALVEETIDTIKDYQFLLGFFIINF
jgi:hypothetical protein